MTSTVRLFLFKFNSSSSTRLLSPASISTLNDHGSGFPNNKFLEFSGDEMIEVSLYRYEQEDDFAQFVQEFPSSKDLFLVFEPVSPERCALYHNLIAQLETLEVSPLSIPANTTHKFPLFQECYKRYWEGLIRASKAHLPCSEVRDVEKISGIASWSRMISKIYLYISERMRDYIMKRGWGWRYS